MPVQIDPTDGDLLFGPSVRLAPGQSGDCVRHKLGQALEPWFDHRNGYVWMRVRGYTFGTLPATVALCFREGTLHSLDLVVDWSGTSLPQDDWTNIAADAKIAFYREELHRQVGFDPSATRKRFPWGEIWSGFDPKGGFASIRLTWRKSSA